LSNVRPTATKAGLIGTKLNAYEVDIRSHTIKNGPNAGGDFYKVNPKGNVPTIKLEDGTIVCRLLRTFAGLDDDDRHVRVCAASLSVYSIHPRNCIRHSFFQYIASDPLVAFRFCS
jgi:glutathione S-transferase